MTLPRGRGVNPQPRVACLPLHLLYQGSENPSGDPSQLLGRWNFCDHRPLALGMLCASKVKKLKLFQTTVRLFLNIFLLWVFRGGAWKLVIFCWWYPWERKMVGGGRSGESGSKQQKFQLPIWAFGALDAPLSGLMAAFLERPTKVSSRSNCACDCLHCWTLCDRGTCIK